MATITIAELLGISSDRASVMNFDDIVSAVGNASAATLAILASQSPILLTTIAAITVLRSAYTALVTAKKAAKDAKDVQDALLPPPTGTLNAANTASDVAEKAGAVALDTGKNEVVNAFNTPITVS